MKQILCLSTEPWSRRPGRTQQLVTRLHDAQILYFYPSQNLRPPKRQRVKVRPNVAVYALPAMLLPLEERHGVLFRWQQRRLGQFIAQQAARHRFREPLLWTTRPDHIHLLDQLSYSGLVYDCDREWDGLPPRWEGALAQAADVVFAASPLLADRLSPCSANIALVPNGLNCPLFSPDTPRPDPLPGVRGPVIGWAGTIREGLDLAPLLYAALEQPDWTFLLLGRRRGRNPLLSRLSKLPNVLIPGACLPSEVPKWLYRCDVLVELLQEDRPDDLISPRLYEYLATGKPVVSMLWPDQVEPFPDVVYGAHTAQDFLHLCRHALEEAPGFSRRRRDHAAAASWPLRAGEVERILTTAGLFGAGIGI